MNLPSSPLATLIANADGKIVRWDRECEQLTGYPAGQVQGRAIWDMLAADVPDQAAPPALRAGLGFTAHLAHAGGPGIPVEVTVSAEAPDSGAGQAFRLTLLPARPPTRTDEIRDLSISAVIEDLPGVFYVIDESLHLILWNHALEEVLGMSADELYAVETPTLFDERGRPDYIRTIRDAFEHGQSSAEGELVGKDGKRTPFLFHCARSVLAGKPCIVGTGLDISSRKQAERGLQIRERALYSSVNAIIITCCENDENHIEYVNPAFEQMTGYTLAEIKGRDPRFMRIEGCDEHEHQRLREAIHRRESVRSVLRNRRKNGEIFWNDLRIDPVTSMDGEVTHFVAVINDVTEARHYERRLHHLAHHDPLTGLANRTLLLERLQPAIDSARRNRVLGALAFLDLDNFKLINDKFGHDAGDAVLRAIAERLRASVRDDDTVARFGGDEFVLLIHEQPSHAHLSDMLERVRLNVSAPVRADGHEIVPGTSIGASVFPDDGDNADRIMRAADAAMYHAKSLGKNNVQFYSVELGHAMHHYLVLQAGLSHAIRNDELVLGYQPKVCLRSGRVIGAEALVRWLRPEHGVVPPDSFIPMAEETGLIVPLGDWVLNEACKALQALAKAGIDDFVISVNLSARQLRQRDFAQRVAATLARHGVMPRNLELEVTESQLMDRPADAKDALQLLKDLGVRLSIDDFGTGYSSLSHLRSFPVDYIKIDRSFLTDLCQDEHAVIPRAIIALGHNLKLQVVAEGVETGEQLAFLRDHGCDQMQGFYFSAAVPVDQLQEMIVRGARLNA